MSQDVIDQLTADKEALQKQMNGAQDAFNGLIAQLDASKQMFNDSLASCLQLRTNSIMLQKHGEKLAAQLAEKDKTIEALNAQLEQAAAKINELSTASLS